jgi:hypothetical protein
MSHLVNHRMGKRQPMRWSAEGAYPLLQVCCAVLYKQLDTLVREWYPRFRINKLKHYLWCDLPMFGTVADTGHWPVPLPMP